MNALAMVVRNVKKTKKLFQCIDLSKDKVMSPDTKV